MIYKGIASVFLLYLSGEILLRRWFWNQIPRNVSSPLVYGCVIINIIFIWYLFSGSTPRKSKN
jgi:hypothetical protein